ncbi:MAG: PSD1 and planctomycete cytochrome C domain-containing protein [Planctomycetaceae bacterium]
MPVLRFVIALSIVASGLGMSLNANEPSVADLDFFEKRVRPLLVQRCFECHSAKAEKLKGGLLLDSREAILAGGDSGSAAVVGDVEKSLIVQAIRFDNENVQMPPAGKLPEAEIAVLTEWVRRGLPFTAANSVKISRRAIDIDEGKKHWAFRPFVDHTLRGNDDLEPRPSGSGLKPSKQPLPDGRGSESSQAFRVPATISQPRSRIDDFVFAAQTKHGLSPSPEASKQTLIRRLSFDLLGLPPTVDDVHDFVADESPDAYERLVERMLADPRFGERWTRTWLDLARYCDIGESWRTGEGQPWLYRDWVVQAMNEDVPYDGFVRKQLAADLMLQASELFNPNANGVGGPGVSVGTNSTDTHNADTHAVGVAVKHEDLAALGLLGLSPSYWKELKLDHNVIKQVVAEEWEERIEAIGGTFLGLTLACARCHDHKFDPITQQDYYGLAGVLASIKIDDRPIIAKPLADQAADARRQLKESQAQLEKLLKEPKPSGNATDEEKAKAAEVVKQVEGLRAKIAALQQTPQLNTPVAFGVSEASMIVLPDGPNRTKIEYRPTEPQNVAMQIRGNAANLGAVVSRRFVTVLSAGEPAPFKNGSGRLELANAIVTDAAPLAARVIVNRIWAHHFGRGLVATPSNFGTQGEKPTHPELLDDLAARFIEHGWSLKWLHRETVLSATYRQSSADSRQPIAESRDTVFSEEGKRGQRLSAIGSRLSVDPENVWLARMPLRKLDVEAWRDAMLVATGEMDRRVGGAPQELSETANVRRTVYGLVRRRELSDLLRLHDFPDPVSHSGSRMPTTTPLQQLFVLNSSYLQARAAALASRVLREHPQDTAAQIRTVHRWLFAREATDEEIGIGSEFLVTSQSDGVIADQAWRHYAQALLATNELQFVE